MIGRRGLLALLGGLPFMSMPQRPDQVYDPPLSGLNPASSTGIFRKISIGSTVILSPSNDTTGVLDSQNVQHFLNSGFQVTLAAGTFYSNTTITMFENQFVTGAGRGATNWHLTATGIPAFKISNKVPTVLLVQGASGGISGVTILGPSSTVCPTDGTVGVQFANIYHGFLDVEVIKCQWGFLFSNDHFWTEAGTFTLYELGCTNPCVFQIAPTGLATRTGSFARNRVTVYHNDTTSGAFGLGGVQYLAGAIQLEGSLSQFGNVTGTGQAGVYALYVSGSPPVGISGDNSNLRTVSIQHGLEYDGTGTKPGTIFIDSGCGVEGFGGLDYGLQFGPSNINAGGDIRFDGPITGDATLITKQYVSITPSLAGLTGSILSRPILNTIGQNGGGDQIFMEFQVTVAAATAFTAGTVLAALPAGLIPATNQPFQMIVLPFGGTPFQALLRATASSGNLAWIGANFTAPGGGSSTILGCASVGMQL